MQPCPTVVVLLRAGMVRDQIPCHFHSWSSLERGGQTGRPGTRPSWAEVGPAGRPVWGGAQQRRMWGALKKWEVSLKTLLKESSVAEEVKWRVPQLHVHPRSDSAAQWDLGTVRKLTLKSLLIIRVCWQIICHNWRDQYHQLEVPMKNRLIGFCGFRESTPWMGVLPPGKN